MERLNFKSSAIANEVCQFYVEGFGDFCEGLNRYFIFRPFNIPDVIARQVSFFGKLFLGKASFDPFGPDRFAEEFGDFAGLWHGCHENKNWWKPLPSMLGKKFLPFS